MLGVYAEHVRSEFLPFLGQQAGLFGFLYGFVYISPGIVAISLNGAMILGWIVIMMIAGFAN